MKALSIGGRLTLLKSMLGSIPIFHTSIFRVPSSVLHTLESIRIQFFNGHEVGSNKATWVKWNSVLTAKDSEGLGVSSLYALNKGLMMKWVWRFYNQKTSLWANVIKAIHGEDGSMENGKSMNVCTKLSDPSMDYSFRRKTKGGAEQEQLDALMDLVSTINLVSMGDRWVWTLESSGEFSVASLRKVIDEKRLLSVCSKTRWVKGFFKKQKLTGPNFIDWYRQLRIVLSIEDKLNSLEQPISPAPVAPVEIAGLMLMTMKPEIQQNLEPLHAHEMLQELKTLFGQQAEQELFQTTRDFHSCRQEEGQSPISPAPVAPVGQHVATEILAAHNAWIKGSKEIAGLMLMTMKPEIQQNLEPLHAHEMLQELKTLFAQQAEQELFQTTRDFYSCRQEEGQSVSSYVLKMKGYIDNLECLGHPVTLGLGVSLILIGLRKKYDGFVQNYNMHNMGKTVNELHAMLKLHEQTLPKTTLQLLCYSSWTLEEELSSVFSRVAKEEKERSFGSWWFRNNVVYFSAVPWDGIFEIDLSNSNTNESSIYAHKHEVFETFKVFQKKVENQLGKTIKALRSDRGGEYMSQEFLDNLKDHGIIAHRTPPYTPQYNDIRAIRILIAIAAYYDYDIWQMDVKTAFLNRYLNEERYCKENSKRGSIPMQEKLKLSKSQGASTPAELKRMQNVSYALGVGSIMYAVRCTRPDVAFAQNTGYVFVLNGGAVDWKSAKQSIFATSSAKAEYIAAFDSSKEAVWVRKFIYGLGVVPTIEEPICMYCDNTGAITIANESGITKGARHFHAKVHYIREVIGYSDIKLEKVHTYDNLADPFTKALAFPKHYEHTRNIRMLPASSLMVEYTEFKDAIEEIINDRHIHCELRRINEHVKWWKRRSRFTTHESSRTMAGVEDIGKEILGLHFKADANEGAPVLSELIGLVGRTNSNDFEDKGASFDVASYGHNKDKHGPSQASESDNQERPNAESSTKTVNTARPVNTVTPTYVIILMFLSCLIWRMLIHKDHPKEQIIGEVNSAVQTSKIAKQNEAGLISFINRQRRTNHKDFQNCLFACVLSQMEPKKVTQGLDEESWIEAMQEELLQFKLQNVWTLVVEVDNEMITQITIQNKFRDNDNDEEKEFIRTNGSRIVKMFLYKMIMKGNEKNNETLIPLTHISSVEDKRYEVVSSCWSFIFVVPGQMTYPVASLILDSARSYVMQGTPFTKGMISSIPIGGNIILKGFLLPILLLVVIIITVFIVAVILVVVVMIIGVVIFVTIIGVVVVIGVFAIIKLSFVIIGFLHRIMLCYMIH
nr:zinc finger, CCHC-type [Tanacetum cinerariifolium]